jgi:tetratricopeptide (TPR) repeat protein
MTTAAEMFALAWQHHQAGGFPQAEQLYRQVLQANPRHADAWCFLGAVCQAQGKFAEAEVNYRRAIQLAPMYGSAHNCLGALLAQQNRLAEAATSFQQALRHEPDNAEAHYNLGLALHAQGQRTPAIEQFRQALHFRPDYPEALTDLGNVLAEEDKLDEAVHCYRQALRVSPVLVKGHYNLGTVLGKQDKFEEEIGHYREALRLQPDHAEAHVNLGNALRQLGRMDEAKASLDKALRLKPDDPLAHWNRAVVLLLRGEFDLGWPEYEWRWAQHSFARRNFQQPLWDGSDLAGRTILLHAEQGLGDTIHFIRYAPLVKLRGGTVIVECQPPLLRLLTEFPGIDQLLPRGSQLPAFDVRAPLLSLPGIFQSNFASIPATVPYLHADAQLVKLWRRNMSEVRSPMSDVKTTSCSDIGHRTSDFGRAFRIGIAWQGDPTNPAQRHRSIPLAHYAPLTQVPGVELISLQKGPGTEQLSAVNCRLSDNRHLTTHNYSVRDLGERLDEAAGAFMDTAAVMMNLDLVISSDTAVAHLAGALGIPVWLPLPLIPDWRWLLQREDSPWYPTMRIFRQTRHGHWSDVFDRMADELNRATDETRIKHG